MSRILEIKPLLVRPVSAGVAIGQAEQTSRNQLSNPQKYGEFPLPVVEVGKFKRKMVKVSDIEDFVAGLEPIAKPVRRGRPTKRARQIERD